MSEANKIQLLSEVFNTISSYEKSNDYYIQSQFGYVALYAYGLLGAIINNKKSQIFLNVKEQEEFVKELGKIFPANHEVWNYVEVINNSK